HFARGERVLRSSRRMLLPELLDLVVRCLPIRNGSSPVAENRCLFARRPLGRRFSNRGTHRCRERIGLGTLGARHGESEAAQVVVLVVVAVPAAVVLGEAELQSYAACMR